MQAEQIMFFRLLGVVQRRSQLVEQSLVVDAHVAELHLMRVD
jgi:hypothetical protein